MSDSTKSEEVTTTARQAEMLLLAKGALERNSLTADDLLNGLSLDDNGRKWQSRVELGQLDPDLAAKAVIEDLAAIKSRLDFALRKEISRRWLPHVRRRAVRLKAAVTTAIQQLAEELQRNPDVRPAPVLRELIRLLEAEIGVLKRRQAEYQAGLNRVEEQLRTAQTEIEGVIQAKGKSSLFSWVKGALFSALSQGVSLVAQMMNAERLVNDREEYAFLIDLGTAAVSLQQEAIGLVQQKFDRIMQFRVQAEAALSQTETSIAVMQARLCAHPYAQVDETSSQQAEWIAQQVGIQPISLGRSLLSDDLSAYFDSEPTQLRQSLLSAALTHAHQKLADISLVGVLEMRAARLVDEATPTAPTNGDPTHTPTPARDLVVDAMGLAMDRASAPTLAVLPEARAQDWWLVGVLDETNPGFHFGTSLLVSTRRRDQLQFLRVQTGLTPEHLADMKTASQVLEAGLRERNYYVTSAMLADSHMQRAFALGLACGLIGLQRGAFTAQAANGSEVVSLGATPEAAVDTLANQPELAQHLADVVDALPMQVLVSHLDTYLTRTGDNAAANEDEFWVECATLVRARLDLAKQQLRYAAVLPKEFVKPMKSMEEAS